MPEPCVPTDPVAMRRALDRIRPELVVFEAGTASGWLADICRELGLPFLVANTMGEAWSWRKVKRKSDRDDALKLARMAALGELPAVHVPTPEARQYRCLVAYRDKLIGRRTAVQNHIRGLCRAQGVLLPAGHRAWTEAGRTAIAALARPLADCGPTETWRGELDLELLALVAIAAQLRAVEAKLEEHAAADARVRLLRTIPGGGVRPLRGAGRGDAAAQGPGGPVRARRGHRRRRVSPPRRPQARRGGGPALGGPRRRGPAPRLVGPVLPRRRPGPLAHGEGSGPGGAADQLAVRPGGDLRQQAEHDVDRVQGPHD